MVSKYCQKLGILFLLVSLSACGSSSSSSNRVGFVGVPPNPTMATPNSARGSQSTPVVIMGTNLDSVSGVSLFGTALSVTNVTATQINVVVPAGLPGGNAPFVFSFPGGTVSNPAVNFTVLGRDSVMITEVGNGGGSTNDFEFIEISNPTANPIDLSNYYITDAADTTQGRFYWLIADNPPNENCWSQNDFDFICRFPAGTTIQPGQFITIGMGDYQAGGSGGSGGGNFFFFDTYGRNPDFEIRNGADDNDGITDMLNLMNSNGFTNSSIGTTPSVPNSGEALVLFHWDGQSDLVQDVDYFAFGGATTASNPEATSKTGVTIGGSSYLADTAVNNQADFPVSPNQLTNGLAPFTYQRIDFFEGNEVSMGGNGITGNDETSEDYDVTFATTMPASPGFDYPARPRAGESNVSITSDVRFRFYRPVSATTQPNTANFLLTGPSGLVSSQVNLDTTTNTVVLTPDQPLLPGTTYTVTVTNAIQPDGGSGLGFFLTDFTYQFRTAP